MRKWKFVILLICMLFLFDYSVFSENFFTFRKNIFSSIIELKAFDNEEKLIDIMDSIYLANIHSKNYLVTEYRYLRYDLINGTYDKEKFKKGIVVFNKGLYYYILELFAKSYEEFQKSTDIFKGLGAYAYVFDSYMMCAILSFDIKDYDRAQKLITEASLWLPKIKNDTLKLDRTAVLNWNYGKLYLDMGNLDKAKFHLDSSRRLVEYLKNLKSIYQVDWNYYIVYLTLSKYFEQKGQLDSALAMYDEIKNLSKIVVSNHDLYTYLLLESIIKIYLKQKKYKLAVNTINQYFKDLDKGSELYGKFYIPKAKLALYDELAEAYYQLGDYEHSYQIQKELNQIYAQTMVEYKPLDAISAKLDMEHKLREEQFQQKMTNFILGAIILIILLLALIYYQRYRKTKKLNRQLYELNETKNRLFRIISHDLRGPILSINQLITSIHTKYDKMNEETKLNLFNDIYFSTNKVANLLENLLQWSQFQIKSRNNIKEEIFVKDAIQEVLEQVDYLSKSKHIEIYLDCLSCDKISMNKNEFEVLIRNLLTNSLKFSDDGGNIEIRGQKMEGKTTIEIVDNGIGMSEEVRKNIFNKSNNYQRNGKNSEKGSGLGLLIVKDILERNHGNIELIPNNPQGLIVKIELIN